MPFSLVLLLFFFVRIVKLIVSNLKDMEQQSETMQHEQSRGSMYSFVTTAVFFFTTCVFFMARAYCCLRNVQKMYYIYLPYAKSIMYKIFKFPGYGPDVEIAKVYCFLIFFCMRSFKLIACVCRSLCWRKIFQLPL